MGIVKQMNDYLDQNQVVHYNTGGKKVFVISDLHLAAGLNKSSNYQGTENFYADGPFARFLDHLQHSAGNGGSMLVINGDFIDYLRILEYPQTEEEFNCWKQILEHSDIYKSVEELKTSINKKEKEYGLKTHDYKSIWKLYICMNGHRRLFKRLSKWVAEGNELFILTGNHDLEWHWPAIHRYFRFALWHLYQQADKGQGVTLQQAAFYNSIHFCDHALLVDQKIHIEHGHKYERTTAVDGDLVLPNGKELNLPFGSFFNRYLINRLELAYPYLDNVRPMQNILPVLIRERFPLALKVLFKYIPFTLLIIPKRMYWYAFKYLLNIIFIIVLPVVIFLYAIYKTVTGGAPAQTPTGIAGFALNVVKDFGFLFLSYIFGRIMAMAGLKSPPSLSVHAKKIMEHNPGLEVVIFGHTHNPEQQYLGNEKWYFNTGTWIPIFETTSADVRLDRTFTFLAVDCNTKPACSQFLQRWNDDAERLDPMILNDKN